jgi:hypothetical protein
MSLVTDGTNWAFDDVSWVRRLPITLAGWVKLANLTDASKVCMAISNSGTPFYQYYVDQVANRLRGVVEGGAVLFQSPVIAAADVWHSYCLVIASDRDFRFYFDGGNKQTDATVLYDPAALNRLSVGGIQQGGGAAGAFFNGKHGWNSVYTRAFDDAAAADWHAGVVPTIGRLHALDWAADPAGSDPWRYDRDYRARMTLSSGAAVDAGDNPTAAESGGSSRQASLVVGGRISA